MWGELLFWTLPKGQQKNSEWTEKREGDWRRCNHWRCGLVTMRTWRTFRVGHTRTKYKWQGSRQWSTRHAPWLLVGVLVKKLAGGRQFFCQIGYKIKSVFAMCLFSQWNVFGELGLRELLPCRPSALSVAFSVADNGYSKFEVVKSDWRKWLRFGANLVSNMQLSNAVLSRVIIWRSSGGMAMRWKICFALSSYLANSVYMSVLDQGEIDSVHSGLFSNPVFLVTECINWLGELRGVRSKFCRTKTPMDGKTKQTKACLRFK